MRLGTNGIVELFRTQVRIRHKQLLLVGLYFRAN